VFSGKTAKHCDSCYYNSAAHSLAHARNPVKMQEFAQAVDLKRHAPFEADSKSMVP
jgi:hypothetical protein